MSAGGQHDASDRLAAYALGILDAAEAAEVEAELAADPALRAELDALRETVAALGQAAPASAPAPAALWSRIESSLSRSRPFEPFVARIAAALATTREAARAMLDRIDLASAWSAGPSETSRLYHIQPGPSMAGVLAGFVKVAPGQRFPRHTHHGEELVMILQGGLRDEDGSVARAGDEVRKAAGTNHEFTALDGEELIYLAVIWGTVEFETPFEI